MLYLLLSIVLLGVVVAFTQRKKADEPLVVSKGDCSTCDGTPAVMCEQECMMKAATEPIEYFDDEELDVYRGRNSDAYSDEEAEQFREVLLTMRSEEVAAWGRSLRLREINLPDQVKDDFTLLVS